MSGTPVEGIDFRFGGGLLLADVALPGPISPAETPALVAGVSAALADAFLDVHAVDVTSLPDNRIRLLHTASDGIGRGVVVESLFHAEGCTTWVCPVEEYAARLAAGRRAMDGRRPLAVPAKRPDPPLEWEVSFTVDGRSGAIARRGSDVRARFPSIDEQLWLPASTLPGWLVRETGLGPRRAGSDDFVVMAAGELKQKAGRRWALGGVVDALDTGERVFRVVRDVPSFFREEVGAEQVVGLRRTTAAAVFRDLCALVAR
ncbi:hypothetical protein [Actinokineospora enzanensis]|uniref:hypothetical protein n=1 Tax=Actinokineospora enzanensis TaxID=155975 RepID=UPI0003750E87|nr:hypothetical protein [Actinokineospora enzanensis]